MINTESIRPFWKSLPVPTASVRDILFIVPQAPDENGVKTIELAFRGYLGCVAFAGVGRDQIILRLLPNRKLNNSSVAVAWGFVTEGMTIAPDLEHFVAGRLAQMDIANSDNLPNQETQNQLIDFAKQFGNPESTQSVLNVLQTAKNIEEELASEGAIWAAIDANNPMCQALAGSRSLREENITEWANQAIQKISEISIVWRIYLASQLRNESNIDITEAAWRLILDDDVFDCTYTGSIPGPSTSAWENEPLVQAVHWLQEQPHIELPKNVPDSLWRAAQIYAEDPLNYDGSAHLASARQIADFDPVLAYTHTANAAAFFARATKERPSETIIFAHELAVKNGWEDLRMVLDLAESNFEFDLDDF